MDKNLQKSDIKNFSKTELIDWLKQHKLQSYRAGQIFKWIYLKQADFFGEMTDLSIDTREHLENHFTIDRLEIETIEKSNDGTQKFLFRLKDGNFTECVLIPGKDRNTICISSQVGCAQACSFCMTAQGGFVRNLSAGEIISQVRDIRDHIGEKAVISNIVMMGMGEPLANYDNVIKALSVITDSDFGLKFSVRKVTVSTSGIVPQIEKMGRDTRVNLAISLNATTNEIRNSLMPVNKTYPIEKLLEACKNYPLTAREKITFEYILMQGVNDSAGDAKRLVKLLSRIKAKVNLIPFNEHEGCRFRRPDDKAINSFLQILLDGGVTSIIRKSMGQDISAACGQLNANAKCERKDF